MTLLLARHAPLGLRLSDAVTGAPVREGLRVELLVAGAKRRVPSTPGLEGVHAWHNVPGFGAWTSEDAADWRHTGLPVLICVDDLMGRYLPLRVRVRVPTRDLLTWTWAPGEAPRTSVPMARAITAPGLEGHANLYAELWHVGRGAPAAWALLQATCRAGAGETTVRGLADHLGRVRIDLPWPEPPLIGGLPLASAAWNLTLSVRYAALPGDPLDPDGPPTLREIEAQPPAQLWADAAATDPLGSATLRWGQDLILRGAVGPGDHQPIFVTT